MIINYRQPYWIKFQWDLSSHHENQYVTEFNKSENQTLTNKKIEIIQCYKDWISNKKNKCFVHFQSVKNK